VTLDPLNMLVVFGIIYVGVQYFHASLATLGIFLFILLQLSQLAKNFNGGRQTLVSLIDSLISVRDVIVQGHGLAAHRRGQHASSKACARASVSRT
jgi:hypothetical protein